jgi:hypothetical protein
MHILEVLGLLASTQPEGHDVTAVGPRAPGVLNLVYVLR